MTIEEFLDFIGTDDEEVILQFKPKLIQEDLQLRREVIKLQRKIKIKNIIK